MPVPKQECVACTHGTEEVTRRIQEGIEDAGWVLVPVVDGNFAYTVGLTETYDRPEFLVDCRDLDTAMYIIQSAVTELDKNIDAFTDKTEVPGLFEVLTTNGTNPVDGIVGCRPVSDEFRTSLLGRAVLRYGVDGFQALQLVIPDVRNKLPWHPGCTDTGVIGQRCYYSL
jgi:hypothetical protein